MKRLFGFKRMANFKAVMRLFNKFTQADSEALMDSLYRWLFDQLSLNGLALDLDSTVMTRYDAQEGAARRYDQRKSLWDNPAKRGRASHHPLMAFVADTRIIANCWLRPGNSSSANNVQVFVANTPHRLGGKHVSLPLRSVQGHVQCLDGNAASTIQHKEKWLAYAQQTAKGQSVRKSSQACQVHRPINLAVGIRVVDKTIICRTSMPTIVG